MEFTEHGDGDDDLLFVMGWGNAPDQPNVAWFLSELTAGYTVHAAEIPTNVVDFEREFVRPIARYAEDRDFDRILSHSTGGLIAPFLQIDVPGVHLSPWWGLKSGVQTALFPPFSRIPTDRRLLPTGFDFDAIGDIAESPEREGPGGLSPSFVREIRRAQSALPAFDARDAVFCTLTDELVSVPAIGEQTPAANLRVYDGNHEFFSSTGREAVLDDVLTALDRGPAAIR